MKNLLTLSIIFFYSNLFSQNYIFFDKNNSGLSSNHIISVKQDSSNAYWIVTAPEFENGLEIASGYLHKYKSGQWTLYDSLNSFLLKNIVADVEIDRTGKVVIATSKGIIIKDNENYYVFDKSNSPLPDNDIFTVAVDYNNKYYIGIPNFGVTVYNNGTWFNYNYQNSFNGIEDLNFIFVDKSNHIWIGTDYYGLFMFDGVNWHEKINKTYNNKNCAIMGISEDINGVKFVALQTSDRKHYIASGTDYPFTFEELADTNYPFVFLSYNSIKIDKKNNLYVGTTNGLFMNSNNRWTVFDSTDFNIGGNYFSSGFVDKNNNKVFCVGNFLQNKKGLLFFNEDGVNFTGVDENGLTKLDFTLSQNYPNPFNPSTNINFTLPNTEFVTLKIYDVLGKEVATLINEELNAGNHTKIWDAKNLSSGVYFYKLQAGKFSETKKMILVR
jgi:hypothetical protein